MKTWEEAKRALDKFFGMKSVIGQRTDSVVYLDYNSPTGIFLFEMSVYRFVDNEGEVWGFGLESNLLGNDTRRRLNLYEDNYCGEEA